MWRLDQCLKGMTWLTQPPRECEMYGMSANGKGHTRNFMALAPPPAHRNDLLWELYTADISTLDSVVKAVHAGLIDSIGKHLLHTKHGLYSSAQPYTCQGLVVMAWTNTGIFL